MPHGQAGGNSGQRDPTLLLDWRAAKQRHDMANRLNFAGTGFGDDAFNTLAPLLSIATAKPHLDQFMISQRLVDGGKDCIGQPGCADLDEWLDSMAESAQMQRLGVSQSGHGLIRELAA